MKLAYYADTDSLSIEFVERPSTASTEIAVGVVVDFDDQGQIVGIDIDNARNKLDLDRIVVSNMPGAIEVTAKDFEARRTGLAS